MSLIWIICGAGRRVGKTTVALGLRQLLPDSVYAKCGHAETKPGKPGNYFNNLADLESFVDASRPSYEHIIVESNTLAANKRGDIIVFIDGIAAKTDFRDDVEQLRSVANLKLSRDASLGYWQKVLSAKIRCKTTRNNICDLLLAQKRYLFGSKPTVRSKVWFEAAGAHVFGSGIAKLLENVYRLGSLQEAAKAAGMSYRYAWDLINMAENHFGKTLIDRHTGGRHGGGSALSAEGLRMLEVFRQLNEDVAAFTDERFLELYRKDQARADV